MPEIDKTKVNISKTSRIPNPTEYVAALKGECANWAFDEEKSPTFKGGWREKVFSESKNELDLEIGTGNGFHFANYAKENPDRLLVGIELKYKPLIQTIRRALSNDSENMRVVRYNAHRIDELFMENELDNMIIHFPDPYLKKKFRKRRLLTENFLKKLSLLQKNNSKVYFKTDSEDYFDWAIGQFEKSPYKQIFITRDLHNSEKASENFITAFENIFLKQSLPIYYAEFLLNK